MAPTYPTVLELIGNTPIVRFDRFGRETGATLLAKLEFLNPGGSNKDRIGLAMIEAAEREGLLRPGGRPRATPASASRSPRRTRATAASS